MDIMNTGPSAFQLEHPLSAKKFWKKWIVAAIGQVIFSGLLSVFGSLVMVGVWIALTTPSGVRHSIDLSQLGFVLFGSWSGLLIVLLVLFLGGNAWYLKAYIRRYYYNADDNFLTIRKGVFAPTEIHVQYGKIQDVYVDQDMFDRFFGLYDVHIASATAMSGIEAHIDGADATVAGFLKEYLLGRIARRDTSHVSLATPPATMPTAPSVSVPVGVSSEAYPIDARWLPMVIVGSILRGGFFTLIVGGQLIIMYMKGAESAGEAWPLIIFMCMFLCLAALQIVGQALWKKYYSWSVMPEYFLMREGVISRTETHLPYTSIQDVVLSQGVIERLFGLCTLTIQNAVQNVSSSNRNNVRPTGPRIVGQPLAAGQTLLDTLRNLSAAARQTQSGL